jgi:hypothetical protein
MALQSAASQYSYWLAISLTPGLGPTRGRKLVQHFGTPDAIFQAPLTELEATGMLPVSAQSIATGTSLNNAEEEMPRQVLQARRSLPLPTQSSQRVCSKSMIRHSVCMYAETRRFFLVQASL